MTIQRLEAAETALARALDGHAGLPALGGYASFVSAHSPLTRVVGAGVNGPVDPAEIEAVARFYAERHADAVYELCPLADEAFLSHLQDRGYRVAQFQNTLVLHLTQPPAPPTAALGLTRAEDWAHWTAQGFFSRSDVSAEEVSIGHAFARIAQTYVAEIDGQPAATAALWLHDEVAFFLADATLPAYRGRGLQQALIQQRLIDALAAGAKYATAATAVNSLSQTNYLRSGFRVLYTKFSLSRP